MKNYIVLSIKDGPLYGAEFIEDVLCLATLIASGTLPPDSDITDVEKYFNKVHQDCGNCPLNKKCLAFIINK
jgi:hypothetical protein